MTDPAVRDRLRFTGSKGSECEAFISAVITHAFDVGKARHDSWTADFAATCLHGEALRWYLDLDEEIQESWKLLPKALINRFPVSGFLRGVADIQSSSSSLAPTPAAAPLSLSVAAAPVRSSSNIYRGRIKVIFDDETQNAYVSKLPTSKGNVCKTANVSDALEVQFDISERPFRIQMMNTSHELTCFLGFQWFRDFGQRLPLRKDGFRISAMSPISRDVAGKEVALANLDDYQGPIRSQSWLALFDGSLLPTYLNSEGLYFPMLTAVPNGQEFFAVLCWPPESFESAVRKKHSRASVTTLKFVFEQM